MVTSRSAFQRSGWRASKPFQHPSDISRVSSSPSPPSDLNCVRILVASEDAATVEFLDRYLREWGYCAHQVTDGREALRLLIDSETPQIAILDGSLPQLSGVEVTAQLSCRKTKHAVWTMLLCEQADTSVIASAIDAGADDLVLKPIDATDLRIRIGVAARVQVLMNRLDVQTAARSEVEHDSLTGLWNRESLMRMLFAETDRVQRLKTPLALILLDIDHFARINERYGYEAGDKVLRELAKRFRRHLRSYDLVGRCGEDEFLIGLPGCTSEQAYVLIKRLKRNILSRPFAVGREQVSITTSAGISHSQGRSPLVVLREAERALANAKASGRNCERQHSDLDPKQPPEAGSAMRLVPAQEAKQS